MVMKEAFPKGLLTANFERYDPNGQGGQVPIFFVPKDPYVPDEKNAKSSTLKFKI
jgi:hypothetical protein